MVPTFTMFTVPPDRVSVLNENGDHIPHYMLGPYKEGVTVDITCISSGGNVFIIIISIKTNFINIVSDIRER